MKIRRCAGCLERVVQHGEGLITHKPFTTLRFVLHAHAGWNPSISNLETGNDRKCDRSMFAHNNAGLSYYLVEEDDAKA